MKKLIGALLAVFMLVNLSILGSGVGHAADNDEQAVIKSLIHNGYMITADGLTEDFNLEADEGAVLLWLDSTSDLDAFKALSQSGKKELINNLAQSNWGNYVDAKHCYVAVMHDDKLYAASQVTYEEESSALTIEVYDQGTSNAPEWMYAEDEGASESETTPVTPIVYLSDSGVIIKSNTMLPASTLFNTIGGSIQLNSSTGNVTIKYGDIVITGQLNSKYVTVNGETSFYNIPLQVVKGRVMVPAALLKNALKANVEVISGTLSNGKSYMKGVIVTVGDKKIAIPVNDKFETYQKYYGKSAWLITPYLFISDLKGDIVDRNTVKNLSGVLVFDIKRSDYAVDWLDVTITYNARTYIVTIKESNFANGFSMVNPYEKYKFSQAYWQLISERSITAGMSEQMVLLAWGPYSRHTKTTYSWGTTDMWVYEDDYNSDYLYFTNGILKQVVRN